MNLLKSCFYLTLLFFQCAVSTLSAKEKKPISNIFPLISSVECESVNTTYSFETNESQLAKVHYVGSKGKFFRLRCELYDTSRNKSVLLCTDTAVYDGVRFGFLDDQGTGITILNLRKGLPDQDPVLTGKNFFMAPYWWTLGENDYNGSCSYLLIDDLDLVTKNIQHALSNNSSEEITRIHAELSKRFTKQKLIVVKAGVFAGFAFHNVVFLNEKTSQPYRILRYNKKYNSSGIISDWNVTKSEDFHITNDVVVSFPVETKALIFNTSGDVIGERKSKITSLKFNKVYDVDKTFRVDPKLPDRIRDLDTGLVFQNTNKTTE